MQVTRLAVIEEATFNEGEVSTAVEGSVSRSSMIVGVIIRLFIALHCLWIAPITGSLRTQNTRRYPVRNVISVLSTGIILAMISDKTGVINRSLKVPYEYSERIRSVLPLLSLVMLIIGRTREAKPELVLARSRKAELESGLTRQTSGDFVTRYLLVESVASIGLMIFPVLDIPGCLKSLVKRFAPTLLEGPESCSACGSSTIVFPQRSDPCEHVFCYYCAKSERTPFNCHRCHKIVTDFISPNLLSDTHK
jgi:hypothetical protein